MIDISLQGDKLENISMLGELRKGRIGQFERSNGPSEMVVGGASRLPEAMAKSLKSSVFFEKKTFLAELIQVPFVNQIRLYKIQFYLVIHQIRFHQT